MTSYVLCIRTGPRQASPLIRYLQDSSVDGATVQAVRDMGRADGVLDREFARSFAASLNGGTCDDLRARKLTLPIARAAVLLGDPAGPSLLRRIGTMDGSTQDIAACVHTIETSGALDSCLNYARTMVANAWATVDPLLPSSLMKAMVEAFSWPLLHRASSTAPTPTNTTSTT
jgi:hypothetical protein